MITMRGVLVATRELADFFEEVCKETDAYKKAANWVIVELTAGAEQGQPEAQRQTHARHPRSRR